MMCVEMNNNPERDEAHQPQPSLSPLLALLLLMFLLHTHMIIFYSPGLLAPAVVGAVQCSFSHAVE